MRIIIIPRNAERFWPNNKAEPTGLCPDLYSSVEIGWFDQPIRRSRIIRTRLGKLFPYVSWFNCSFLYFLACPSLSCTCDVCLLLWELTAKRKDNTTCLMNEHLEERLEAGIVYPSWTLNCGNLFPTFFSTFPSIGIFTFLIISGLFYYNSKVR